MFCYLHSLTKCKRFCLKWSNLLSDISATNISALFNNNNNNNNNNNLLAYIAQVSTLLFSTMHYNLKENESNTTCSIVLENLEGLKIFGEFFSNLKDFKVFPIVDKDIVGRATLCSFTQRGSFSLKIGFWLVKYLSESITTEPF